MERVQLDFVHLYGIANRCNEAFELSLAQSPHHPARLLGAHLVLGIAWFSFGDLVSARRPLEQASHTLVVAAAGRPQALGAAPPLASRPPRRRRRD
jgi:hypothetical protein